MDLYLFIVHFIGTVGVVVSRFFDFNHSQFVVNPLSNSFFKMPTLSLRSSTGTEYK